jgi:hypothetical protein
MKLPVPTLKRQLILARVILAGEAGNEFTRIGTPNFSDNHLQKGFDEIGLNATLDEFRLVVKSLFEIFSVDMVGSLTSVVAAQPFKGLTVERELELLKEIISRKLVTKLIGKSDVSKIFTEVKEKKSYAAIGMKPEELAFMSITAMNEHAARFQAAIEARF